MFIKLQSKSTGTPQFMSVLWKKYDDYNISLHM